MAYFEKIFGKSHEEFTLNDLKLFFEEEQEESAKLEFKSGDVSLEKIYSEVSAFLNTEGGLLVVGAPKEKTIKRGKGSTKVCQGELTYSSIRNKDWLVQKLAQHISPPPHNLRIFQAFSEEGNIFIVEIPQSLTPPHQYEGKYFIRLEEQAKSAPHGIVQALFQKRQLPKLDANLEIHQSNDVRDKISINLKNYSKIPAEKIGFIVELYNVSNVESQQEFQMYSDEELGQRLVYSDKYDHLLVRVVSLPIDFNIIHKSQEYLVAVSFWCRDVDYDLKFWTFNPITREVVAADRLVYEKVNFLDEVKRVNKLGSGLIVD